MIITSLYHFSSSSLGYNLRMQPDLLSHISAISRQTLPPNADVLTAASALGSGLRVLLLDESMMPRLASPFECTLTTGDMEADGELGCDVTLVVHRGDVAHTVYEVEARMPYEQRIALADLALPERGDTVLLQGLLDSTVYLGSLASYDTDITRALLMPMIPLRDGAAFRRYLVETQLYWWGWRGMVRDELLRRFGATIPPTRLDSAITQVHSRLGAVLLKLSRRGLPFALVDVTFDDRQVDGIRWRLEAL